MEKLKQKNIDNIIPFGRSSQFYFNRAMQEYEKGNLERVKELLELAIKYNEEDIWNYYNLALTLEELGEYRYAIKIWREKVVHYEDLASEAYFHLALCYSEIEELTKFRKYLDLYLEVEDDDEMKDVAFQIMDFLEEDEFSQALEKAEQTEDILKELDKKTSSFLYNQDYKEALNVCFDTLDEEGRTAALLNKTALVALLAELPEVALEIIEEVLSLEDQNVGAMSNLALYHYYNQDEVNLQKVIDNMEYFEFYLLSDVLTWTKTLGIMHKHNRAYNILQQMYWDGEISVELCHQLGVAALNLEKYKKARSYWHHASLIDGVYSPADLYYQMLLRAKNLESLKSVVHYNYEWPLIDVIEHYDKIDVSSIDPEILVIAMKYYVQYGSSRAIDFVKNLIEYLPPSFKQEVVQEILLSSYDSIKYEYLKTHNNSIENTYNYVFKGKLYALNDGFNENAESSCKKVIVAIQDSLERYQDKTLSLLAQKLWYAYCNLGGSKLRRINKEEVWVGAIDYITIYLTGGNVNYEVLADRYNVQVQSIQRAVDDINNVIVK